jgi:hypothetical protein
MNKHHKCLQKHSWAIIYWHQPIPGGGPFFAFIIN